MQPGINWQRLVNMQTPVLVRFINGKQERGRVARVTTEAIYLQSITEKKILREAIAVVEYDKITTG